MQEQIDLLKSQLDSQKGKGEENKSTRPKMSISTPLPKENEKGKGKAVVENSNVIAPDLNRISPTTVSASTSHTHRAIDKSAKDNPKESRNATTNSKDNKLNPNVCAPRNSSPNVTTNTVKESVGSNNMVHNSYLEKARKKAQIRKDGILGTPSTVMNSTTLQGTASSCKPLPRNSQQKTRDWPASKSSCEKENVKQVECNTKNSSSNRKQASNDCSDKVKVAVLNKNVEFVCPTCQKCVFSANHDACVAQYIKKANLRAKAKSSKTPNRNTPVDKKQKAKNSTKWIPTGRSFSQNETSAVSEKKTTPRSCLRWIPTGKVFKTVGLRWIPTGKILDSCTTTSNSENHQDKDVETTTTVDSGHPQCDDSCSSNTIICAYSSFVDSVIAGTRESVESSLAECGREDLYANIAFGNPGLHPLLTPLLLVHT
jgi:predicted RNA-binding Zn-ribbon protein involved in translation (DUF1610 family)